MANSRPFVTKNGAILLRRFGPANGQMQTHRKNIFDIFGKDVNLEEFYINSPTRKGIWAFPAPLDDAFYYHHFFQKHLPKAYKDCKWSRWKEPYGPWSDEYSYDSYGDYVSDQQEIFFKERSAKLKKIIKLHKVKFIWQKPPFYSHIVPKGLLNDGRAWWKYENVSDWVESAKKYSKFRVDSGKMFNADPGDLEIFVPS